jgi:hypothetical protein
MLFAWSFGRLLVVCGRQYVLFVVRCLLFSEIVVIVCCCFVLLCWSGSWCCFGFSCGCAYHCKYLYACCCCRHYCCYCCYCVRVAAVAFDGWLFTNDGLKRATVWLAVLFVGVCMFLSWLLLLLLLLLLVLLLLLLWLLVRSLLLFFLLVLVLVVLVVEVVPSNWFVVVGGGVGVCSFASCTLFHLWLQCLLLRAARVVVVFVVGVVDGVVVVGVVVVVRVRGGGVCIKLYQCSLGACNVINFLVACMMK